jgi:hypothetical protein
MQARRQIVEKSINYPLSKYIASYTIVYAQNKVNQTSISSTFFLPFQLGISNSTEPNLTL